MEGERSISYTIIPLNSSGTVAKKEREIMYTSEYQLIYDKYDRIFYFKRFQNNMILFQYSKFTYLVMPYNNSHKINPIIVLGINIILR